MKSFFDADFVFIWVKSFRKVYSQLCSILQGLGQPTSHECVKTWMMSSKKVKVLRGTFSQYNERNGHKCKDNFLHFGTFLHTVLSSKIDDNYLRKIMTLFYKTLSHCDALWATLENELWDSSIHTSFEQKQNYQRIPNFSFGTRAYMDCAHVKLFHY